MPVVGIDLGTQSLKAIVLDDALVVRGTGCVAYAPRFPAPGWAEQDADLWIAALRPAIFEALRQSGLAQWDIDGIAISGQLDGCVPVGHGGKALAPCIIWIDRRAEAEIGHCDPVRIRDRTGLVLDSSHMAAKIRWFKRHSPKTAKCRTWHQPVSFMVEALCGNAIMDHALASTTMLYALDERDYGIDLLDEFEVDRRQLPDIGEASAPAGRLSKRGAALTGLPQGVPVAIGTGDDFANAIGAGVIAPGLVSCTIGTGEVNAAISSDFRIDPEGLVQTHGFAGGNYYVGNPGWLGGGAVTWFVSTFGVASPEEMSRLAATAPAGSGGLNFLPALSGAMAPRWIASARGAFYGLTSAHGTAECARSVLEGCAFAMRDVLTRLDALGIATDRIRLSGGGAKSRVWAKIRADVSQRPVDVPDITDMAPVGAALLAAVAAGKFDTIQQAASAMPRRIERIDPDPSLLPAYDRAYDRYRKLFELLAPLYAEGA